MPLPELSRRVFQAGLAVFTAGSALCSLAPGLGWLVAFRMMQAIGGSMLNPVAMSVITNTFTGKTERARAIGVRSATYGLSMSLGPVVGGLLVDSVGWRGARLPMVAAGVALAAGGVLLSRLTASSGPLPLAAAFAVFGIGGGVINAPITYTAVSGMPVSQAGVASGIASTSRQIGQVLGIAVTGSILAAGLRGRPLRAGFVAASHAGWLLLAAMGVVIVVLGLATASRWALGTAARTAAAPDPAERPVPGHDRLASRSR